jgi:hypothetical protein
MLLEGFTSRSIALSGKLIVGNIWTKKTKPLLKAVVMHNNCIASCNA